MTPSHAYYHYTTARVVLFVVGPPGIEPGLHAPEACVLPVYYGPAPNITGCILEDSPAALGVPSHTFGLGTASLLRKLARQRSGVLILTNCAKAQFSGMHRNCNAIPGASWRIRTSDLSNVNRML